MSNRRRWRFSFWPVLAFIVMLPVLLGFGVWQTLRGFEKQDTWAEFEAATTAGPLEISGMDRAELDALPSWRKISLKGRYLSSKQFLLDNMSRQGRPGHHVLTPFVVAGADYIVVVDRGWREGLARFAEPPAMDAEYREIKGMLAPFPRPALELAGKPEGEGWPRIVQFPDAEELSQALDVDVVSRRLLLDESAPEGYARDWQAPGIPPARHFGYAVQWFALAAALLVIFFLLARPRRAEDEHE